MIRGSWIWGKQIKGKKAQKKIGYSGCITSSVNHPLIKKSIEYKYTSG